MAFRLECRCGKRFKADDRLAGKRVKCPACGQEMQRAGETSNSGLMLTESTIVDQTPQPSTPLEISCTCGHRFRAAASLAGKRVRCPGCGAAVEVSAARPSHGFVDIFADLPESVDPLATAANSTTGQNPLLRAPRPKGVDSKTLFIGAAAGGGVVLIGAILVMVSLMGGSNRTPSEPIAARPAVGISSAHRPAAPVITRRVPVPASGQPSTSAVGPDSENPFAKAAADAKKAVGTAKPIAGVASPGGIEAAMASWYRAGRSPFRGTRSVKPDDPIIAQYGWMCQLLPYLGQEKLYAKLSFNQPWISKGNLPVAVQLIPQFLDPDQPRIRWKGHPLGGLALTHFVGMSGVETKRNEVAAKFPRSDPRAGVFGYDEIARPDQITDGTSQTIMLVGAGELAGPWIAGGGSTVRGAREPYFDPLTGFATGGAAHHGSLVLMADGSTRFLSEKIDPQVFRALCTTHGAETVDLEQAGDLKSGFPRVSLDH